MLLRVCLSVLVVTLLAGGGALAQTRVRTETIKPPAPAAVPDETNKSAAAPDIITDLSRLPPAVAATRERILAAARSGDLDKLAAMMRAGKTMPVFSISDHKDPVAFWKSSYPDSGGIEVLSILITILETGYVHVDAGTAQEIYLWPYFARRPLKTLTAEQKVELFRIVTGADYKDMVEFGAYVFYRLGIGPDGTWHFFVAGD